MEVYTSIVSFFQEGGMFMYPILLVLALGIGIAIERFMYLSYAKQTNRSMWQKLVPLLQPGHHLAHHHSPPW